MSRLPPRGAPPSRRRRRRNESVPGGRRAPIACTVTVAATVMWLGAPETDWVLETDPAADRSEPSPAHTIRIASIVHPEPEAPIAKPAVPAPEPASADAEPPAPELEPTEAAAPPDEPVAEPAPPLPAPPEMQAQLPPDLEEPAPPTEQATLQLEPERPEGLPLDPAPPAETALEAPAESPPVSEAESLSEPESRVAEAPAPVADPEPPAAARFAELAAVPATEPVPAAREPRAATGPAPTALEPVDDVSIAIGRHRIENGRYPHQRASYARIGFERYRDAMLALGGSFYVFDARAGRVLAELDPLSLETRPIDRPPMHQSRWPRDVTRYLGRALSEPDIAARYGAQGLRVVLLPPADLDAAFVGGLDRALRREGIDIERVTQVRIIYELTEAGLECEVARVGLRDGTERHMKLRLALSGPIPAQRSAPRRVSSNGGRS